MNLHSIAGPIVAAINPKVPATVKISTGYTTDVDGNRVPSYTTSQVSAQVQALTFRDLQQVDSLNLQGMRRAIYLDGDIEGVVRSQGKGGDLITFGSGRGVPKELQNTTWLVAMVLETWPDWCKCAVTLQNNG